MIRKIVTCMVNLMVYFMFIAMLSAVKTSFASSAMPDPDPDSFPECFVDDNLCQPKLPKPADVIEHMNEKHRLNAADVISWYNDFPSDCFDYDDNVGVLVLNTTLVTRYCKMINEWAWNVIQLSDYHIIPVCVAYGHNIFLMIEYSIESVSKAEISPAGERFTMCKYLLNK